MVLLAPISFTPSKVVKKKTICNPCLSHITGVRYCFDFQKLHLVWNNCID
uniref:Uncharacterized protein n=1 Tax=Rhizophora mucronata TaxID=61149 RepID=A0A2P2PWW0_RHIMU